MTWINLDAEETLERDTLALFAELGWETVNAYHETYTEAPDVSGGGPSLGRATRSDVILRSRLQAALTKLNPDLPPEAFQSAIEELVCDRSAMALAHANREIYHLLKEGVPVTLRDADGEERFERVQVVDWKDPANNDFSWSSNSGSPARSTPGAPSWSALSTACPSSAAS